MCADFLVGSDAQPVHQKSLRMDMNVHPAFFLHSKAQEASDKFCCAKIFCCLAHFLSTMSARNRISCAGAESWSSVTFCSRIICPISASDDTVTDESSCCCLGACCGSSFCSRSFSLVAEAASALANLCRSSLARSSTGNQCRYNQSGLVM